MRAGNLRRVCEVTDAAGNTLRIEPYMIYTSPQKRRNLHYYQLSSSKAGEPQEGWRSPEASTLTGARMLAETFPTRRDYDPFNTEAFPIVHFSVPTHDARQRIVEKKGRRDHSTFTY